MHDDDDDDDDVGDDDTAGANFTHPDERIVAHSSQTKRR
jgi:hypothetical protein